VTKLAPEKKVFDPVKLDSMVEPLSVRVEKMRGNARTMIPLPLGDDGSPAGSNWTKENIRTLETWLVNEWAGGGMYLISVTDSNQPMTKMEWTSFYPPSEYPEKTPPTLAGAARDPQVPTPQPSQVRSMGSFPSVFSNGLPTASPAPSQGQAFFVPQQSFSTPRESNYQSGFQGNQMRADDERRRYEEQLRDMQGQLARAREEALQQQYRLELDRKITEAKNEQAATNERFSRLEQLMERMMTAAARPAIDPQIEALKEQNRILAAQAENERREREAERRDRELRDLVARQAEESRRQLELITANNKGHDPMMMFLQENARQQIEAVKEQARNQTTQMQQLQTFMMNPRDIMAMSKESSNGLDQVTRQITGAYTDVFNMQRAAVDQILQLQGGDGNSTVALIEKGLDRASSFAERFISGKTKEATVAQQSQAQMAQAQAQAMTAQAMAMQAQAAAANAPQLPEPMPTSTGLNGAGAVASIAPTPMNGHTAGVNDAWTTGPAPANAEMAKPLPKRLGRTDLEWFGPILPKVEELRTGVSRFIGSLQMQPHRLKKDGTVDGVEPEEATGMIMQAMTVVVQQQIPIAAMIDLLAQNRVADFMDVLLPDAPQSYRDDVAQGVMASLSGEDAEDEDEDEGEAEAEGDVVSSTTQPESKPNVKLVPPRARA
jgi:hypothetical protein